MADQQRDAEQDPIVTDRVKVRQGSRSHVNLIVLVISLALAAIGLFAFLPR